MNDLGEALRTNSGKLEAFLKAEQALYELFAWCGVPSAKHYAWEFALSTEHLPMEPICINMQEKIKEEGLLDACAEICGCSGPYEVLGVLGVSYTLNGNGKELVSVVKNLTELLFEFGTLFVA